MLEEHFLRAQKQTQKLAKKTKQEKKGVMKKRLELEEGGVIDEREVEIMKAVAQAWYNHSKSLGPTNEFDARKRNFRGKFSRFKIEAMTKRSSSSSLSSSSNSKANSSWDFGQSLWDSYEIVTLSKRLETGLVFDNPFSDQPHSGSDRVHRKRKESKHSLRNLFSQMSLRRFNEDKIPRYDDL